MKKVTKMDQEAMLPLDNQCVSVQKEAVYLLQMIGTVKLVTTIRGTVEFLENLGKFNQAFSIHFKHQPREQNILKEAYEMVKTVSTYFTSTVDDVKTITNSNRVTNGPEGTISTKTATSLELVEKGLEKLNINFKD